MKLIEATVFLGFCGHKLTHVWVEDDATDEEIEEAILDSVDIEIDWYEKN